MPSLHAENGKTITVQATVPLTPEFVHSIKKNSSLVLEKVAFVPGEEIYVQVRIAGGNNEPLREHLIHLYVMDAQEEAMVDAFGKTDVVGLVSFIFVTSPDFLGSGVIRAIDVTYDTPIMLSQELFFLVYQPENSEEQRKKATKNNVGLSQSAVFGQDISGERRAGSGTNVSQNNGTMVTRNPSVVHARGP